MEFELSLKAWVGFVQMEMRGKGIQKREISEQGEEVSCCFLRLAKLSVFTALEVTLAEGPAEFKNVKLMGFSCRALLIWGGWMMLSAL